MGKNKHMIVNSNGNLSDDHRVHLKEVNLGTVPQYNYNYLGVRALTNS